MWGKPLSYPKRKTSDEEEIPRPRFTREESSKPLRILLVMFVLGIVVVALFIGIAKLPDLQISEIRVEGLRAEDPHRVESELWGILKSQKVSFVPKTNVLFVSKDALAAGLHKKIPSLRDINFRFEDRKILVATLTERSPLFVWCRESGDECYFVDEDGMLFEKAPQFSSGVYIVLRGGKEIPGALSGSLPFSRAELSAITSITELLRKKGYGPLEFSSEDSGDVLVRLESYPNSTGVGAYGLKIGSGTTAGLLDTMLSLLDRDKDFLMAMESHPGDLEYIDFRFPNKIIYKFKQGGDTSVAPQVP